MSRKCHGTSVYMIDWIVHTHVHASAHTRFLSLTHRHTDIHTNHLHMCTTRMVSVSDAHLVKSSAASVTEMLNHHSCRPFRGMQCETWHAGDLEPSCRFTMSKSLISWEAPQSWCALASRCVIHLDNAIATMHPCAYTYMYTFTHTHTHTNIYS
jgi:hypothetical protein